ncbi:MAG: GH3 auxin-responsive promoter family protein [Phycisphaeraceae bacterium]|nr:GH3 auxin-responsive promoter family protein [Phycisphaeraceae bacterium]
MGRWTSIVGHALRARVARRAARLSDTRWWAEHTARVQRAQLRGLLRRAAGCEFGRAHGFARLASLSDEEMLAGYRAAVPVADWYAFREPIARMREGGQPDVLWPGPVRDFAQTSGTTAGDKFIPVSREMMRSNYRASLDIFAHAVRFGISLPGVMGGWCLFIGGSTSVETNEHGVRTGDLSGLVTGLIRWPLSEVYLPGREVALMSDWPAKIDAMARLCVDHDVRFISGMPSWAMVLFGRMLEIARERGRAASCIRDLWPNLRVFVHGGVKYAPFDPRVRRFWSGDEGVDIPHRVELYPASEAFVAIQDEPNRESVAQPSLRLCADHGNFFEFVPLEEIDSASPRAFACDEVEPGVRYVVVLTTCAGLWRYVLGDVVEFDSVPRASQARAGDAPNGPCRLRIVGRHRHFINAFGENIIVEHVENAVASAARETGVTVGEFTAAPVYPGEGRRPGLELAVEIAGEAPAAFAEAFDRALKSQNVDYTTKRTGDLGMAPPVVTPLPPGAFHRWLESRGKLGGQHKCPRCANSREIIESLLAIVALDRVSG